MTYKKKDDSISFYPTPSLSVGWGLKEPMPDPPQNLWNMFSSNIHCIEDMQWDLKKINI